MAEWFKAVDCKSIGFSYVGSNPTFSNNFIFIKKTYLYRQIPVGNYNCKGGTLQMINPTGICLYKYVFLTKNNLF